VNDAELADILPGRVVQPVDDGWDEARRSWNLAIDQHPVAVVLPESAPDVSAAVTHARRRGLRIAFQGGGHNTGPIRWDEPTLLLRTDRMRGITVDPAERRARIEAGVLSDELAAATAAHGLAFLAGTSPDVGVVGYALGGGVGWMVRRHGLAANSITAADVVTADGAALRVDADREPDLFWALRGGGGNFAAVTSLELELQPVPKLYAGAFFWPSERAVEILTAWQAWAEKTPDDCTSLGRLFKVPAVPDVPEPLRGRSFVLVELACVGDQGLAADLVEPLRELGPSLDTVATMQSDALSGINMDPRQPVPYGGEGFLLETLDPESIADVAAFFDTSALIHFELRQLGGAAARCSGDNGALDAIDSPFLSFGLGIAPDPETYEVVRRDLDGLERVLAACDGGRRYLNFTESRGDAGRLFSKQAHERLRTLKARYDPDSVFRANHPIEPAQSG